MSEALLEKLRFADNTSELNDLSRIGIEFRGALPKRVDMIGPNRLAFLVDPDLRDIFHLSLRDLLDPFQRTLAVCIPEIKVYLDFLRVNEKGIRGRTRRHELGHFYVNQGNPEIHKFIEEMNSKMIGQRHTSILKGKHLQLLTDDEFDQYMVLKQVDEGIAQYIAVEAEAAVLGYKETDQLCNYHDQSRGSVLVVGEPFAVAHQYGYRNVVHTCRDLRLTGVNAKEALDLIIATPPANPDEFFWRHDEYAKRLLV